ncbi:MAG: type VI secretion system tip protein TssI/VgrG, partial [Gemmatimonadota bacterium]|nr:type VI secretion system tip protein TssI/VgrG [Gemmatimonadota bacterium]
MSDFTQADRAFRVDTPLGEDVLLLEGFSGQEAMSSPFRFTLELLSKDDGIDPTGVLEQPVLVSMRLADGSDRYFHGFVSRFVQLGKSEDLTSYEAEMVPWLWFMSLSRDCKVFQQKTVLEIVEEVFSEYGNADFTNNCVQSYPSREYCVQYRESDLNFVSRLLEEEGIYYYFEHTSDGHTLTLIDDMSLIQPCPVQSTFEVTGSPEGWLDEDVIIQLQWEHVVNSGRITLRDYDYLQPSNNLEASRGGEGLEVYDYPGRYAEVAEGERYADILLEEERVDQQTLRGSSSCRTMSTGYSFDLSGYYAESANQNYVLTGCWHTARGGGYRS